MINNDFPAGTEAEKELEPMAPTSRQTIANTLVVGSQSPPSNELQIDVTESRVWVQIGNVGIGFVKETFVNMIKQSEGYKYALSLWE